MNKFKLLLLLLSLSTIALSVDGYKFRIELANKTNTPYSIDRPEEFLSERAIGRRQAQNIAIDSSDLPISADYEAKIRRYGFKIIAKSKWFNTITVESNDSIDIEKLKDLDFISRISWVGYTVKKQKENSKRERIFPIAKENNYYGYGKDQIYTVNGQKLHDKGYKGKGMSIAILDAGYTNLKDNLYLSTASIAGYKDFVNNGTDIFSASDHGTNVLSAMGTNLPNTFVGTAPEATYWLLRSEDGNSEYPVEQDYWVTAIEYADSVGVDIVNSSLGYQKFDAPAQSVTYDQIDGKTLFITKAAQKATEKGIFVVVSAGNEGSKEWRKITAPADAQDVLTVGSMSKDSIQSRFSSQGLTADGRIKPDIVAMGEKINLIDGNGTIIVTNGTSFSAPVMAGLAACLWQAYPNLSNIELLNIIRNSSYGHDAPNERYGYGIPDMLLALKLAGDITLGIEDEVSEESTNNSLFTYTSDSIGHLKITKQQSNDTDSYNVRIYDLSGRMLISDTMKTDPYEYQANASHKHAYIIYLIGKERNESKKMFF